MHAQPNEADRARGFAVNDVESAFTVEPQERFTRAPQPSRIPPWQPRMVVARIDVMPSRTFSFFLEKAARVAGRNDLDVVSCSDEAFGE
jgi:hypothetical protein